MLKNRRASQQALWSASSSEQIVRRRGAAAAAAAIAIVLPEAGIGFGAVLKLVDGHLPLEMRGGVLIALVVVPQRHTEAVVTLGIGAGLFGGIENVRRQIDSTGKDGKIASGH